MIKDLVGEKTIFAAILNNSPVLSIRKYEVDAFLNKDEDDPYIMSICYIGARRDGIAFLLTKEGYIVSKKYNFIVNKNSYVLNFQSVKLDTVEPLFDRFEFDCRQSSVLQALDFDSVGKFISHDFVDSCDPFTNRDILSYKEKLQQQKGRRKDPIELSLMMLHEWNNFVMHKIETRHKAFLLELDDKKTKKRFTAIEDAITDEDLLLNAYDELNKIKASLNKNLSQDELNKIKYKFDKIQNLLDKEDELIDSIDEAICEAFNKTEPVKKDLSFIEFGER